MNVKTVVPLALAIILGLFAAIAAKNMIDKNKSQPAQAVRFTQVVVAKDNLAAGSELRAEDLTVGKMAGDVPADVIYGNPAEVTGRVLVASLVKGQPIMEPVLAPKGTGSGLQALVPTGMRAITIEVNEFNGVGGFMVPGCHVDVIATFSISGSQEQFSRTVVQNVKVQAINTHLQPAGPGAEPEQMRMVTLLATPKEAEAINLAAGSGRPRFTLRSSGDNEIPFTNGITTAELAGKSRRVDPFGDLKMAEDTKSSSTQPTEGIDQAALWKSAHSRTITIIRAGVESEATVQVGLPNTQSMTGGQSSNDPAVKD